MDLPKKRKKVETDSVWTDSTRVSSFARLKLQMRALTNNNYLVLVEGPTLTGRCFACCRWRAC